MQQIDELTDNATHAANSVLLEAGIELSISELEQISDLVASFIRFNAD